VKAGIQTIQQEHEAIAAALTDLVHEFDYGRIVELIQAAKQIHQ
jgi:hypothetical protein